MDDAARCDMAYWWPKLERVGVPVPKTVLLRTDLLLIELLDGKEPEGWGSFLASLHLAALAVGGYPVFLRTGQGSGKHDWDRTCFVNDRAALPSHVGALVEWSELVDFVGLPYRTWAVREFLPLVSRFTAFRGMPVAIERRCFFKDGKMICSHPYWPPDSIWSASTPDYREVLAKLEAEHFTDEAIAGMASWAPKFAEHFEGAWSVDFALHVDGRWYVTDMAVAERSFHWPGCEYGPAKESPPVREPVADLELPLWPST